MVSGQWLAVEKGRGALDFVIMADVAHGFPGSTQKDLLDAKRPLSAKYASLFVGKRGLWALLKYEFIPDLEGAGRWRGGRNLRRL